MESESGDKTGVASPGAEVFELSQPAGGRKQNDKGKKEEEQSN